MSWLFPGLFELPNLHPLLVHFPIASWLAAFPLCSFGTWRPRSVVFHVGSWLLHFGTLSGTVAIVSGYLAATSLDHPAPGHDLVHVHRNLMVAAAVLSLITSVTLFTMRCYRRRISRLAQVALIAAVTGLAALGGDRGALLNHRHGIGVGAVPANATLERGHDDPSDTHEQR